MGDWVERFKFLVVIWFIIGVLDLGWGGVEERRGLEGREWTVRFL